MSTSINPLAPDVDDAGTPPHPDSISYCKIIASKRDILARAFQALDEKGTCFIAPDVMRRALRLYGVHFASDKIFHNVVYAATTANEEGELSWTTFLRNMSLPQDAKRSQVVTKAEALRSELKRADRNQTGILSHGDMVVALQNIKALTMHMDAEEARRLAHEVGAQHGGNYNAFCDSLRASGREPWFLQPKSQRSGFTVRARPPALLGSRARCFARSRRG